MPAPAPGERQSLLQFMQFHQDALLSAAHGLNEEQLRAAPTASSLCIGGLIKHLTITQFAWTQRAAAAPDRPADVMNSDNHFVLGDDDTVERLLSAFTAQNAETLRVFSHVDLDVLVAVPDHLRQFLDDSVSVRWAALHIIEELTRHAGHADIIRETLDDGTMFGAHPGAR